MTHTAENPERPGPLPSSLVGKRVVVLGAGKVGTAFATLLHDAGLAIAAVTTLHAETAQAAALLLDSRVGADNASAARDGDIVLVTTSDDAIGTVASEVASAGGFRAGQLVVHTSGALPVSVLGPAADAGALVGCLHPMQSFATARDAARALKGSVLGMTAGPASGSRELLEALVVVLGGHAVEVADADKALYHAAAVTASNYLVAVEDAAVRLLMRAGFDEPSAARALRPLMAGTADNVARLGTTDALTGPIVRGDVATVRSHVDALGSLPGDELGLYRTLGRQTLEIAIRRGTLTPEQVAALTELLAE